MQVLAENAIPFLIGGAYAFRHYTGIARDTKDFDVFLRERDLEAALTAFRAEGYVADTTFPHWLAKVHYGERFIDLVFRAGNGLCEVNDEWFERGKPVELLHEQARLVAPDHMIWQKAYIMERERFDGGDIAHLIRSCAGIIDWNRLLELFDDDWRVLLSHLVLFGFIYPGERNAVPCEVLQRLMKRLDEELTGSGDEERLCRGTLLSRAQYLPDIERWGYTDARTRSRSKMTAKDIQHWTSAIEPHGV